MQFKMNIIGTGNLGKTLGYLFNKSQLAVIQGIYNRQEIHSIEGTQFIGDGCIYHDILELPPADITCIAVPDDHIEDVAHILKDNPYLQANSTILHFSGALSSEILRPIKCRSVYIASVHPLHSFAQPKISIENYTGTFCAIEGDQESLSMLTQLFAAIGSKPFLLNGKYKALYHVAGVFASNYVVTLAQEAKNCLLNSDVPDSKAIEIVLHIMRATIHNLETTLSPLVLSKEEI